MAVTLTVTEDGRYIFQGKSYTITEDKNKLLRPYNKMISNYGVNLELLPEESEERNFNQQIGNVRFLKNRYLNDRIEYYKTTGKTLTATTYKNEYLPKLKAEFEFLKLSDAIALQRAVEDVDQAYKNSFEGRAKFPKFVSKNKPRGNKYGTKQVNDNIKVFIGKRDEEDEKEIPLPYIQLPKVGMVRFILPKKKTIKDLVPENARITSAVVSRVNRRYFIALQVEMVADLVNAGNNFALEDIWAVDLGIKHFGTFGNLEETEVIENPRWIKLHAKRLRRFQKQLSRKQYDEKTHQGSRNWEKARQKVAKEQKKCANQRKDFQHKLSNKIAEKCSVFICEDLNVKGMMKNHRMAKSIASVGWSQFITFVEYKLKKKGGRVVKIDRWFPSSQLCTRCGYKNPEVKNLDVRDWVCPVCYTPHYRDENAMQNIFKEGLRMLREEGICVAV